MDQSTLRLPALSSAIGQSDHRADDQYRPETTTYLQLTTPSDAITPETNRNGGVHIPGMDTFTQKHNVTEPTKETSGYKHELENNNSGQLSSGQTKYRTESRKKQKTIKLDAVPMTQTDSEHNDCDTKSPGLSYIALISMAIQSTDSRRMLLSEIYQWIADRYPYYQMKDKSWRNSIRHNLSLNECFVKCGRSENGKGNYWGIHPANIGDFANGDFRRRRARRQVRKCDEDLQRLCSNSPEPSMPPPMTTVTSPTTDSHDKYVPMASITVPGNFLSTLGFEPMKSFDYWIPNPYPTSPLGGKCYSKTVYGGQSDGARSDFTNPGSYPVYGFHYNPYNRSSMSGIPSTDPQVNVNVNVNVCSSEVTSQYQQPLSIQCHPEQQTESVGLRSLDTTLL